MNKLKFNSIFSVVLSMVMIMVFSVSTSFADEIDTEPNGTSEKATLTGSIKWEDNDNAESTRPETVNVDLYEDDVLIGSTTASSENDWNFAFDVDVKIDSKAGTTSQYKFEQNAGEKYSTSKVTNPNVEYTEAQVGEIKKYTPCNVLEIPAEKLSNQFIVGKLTGKYADAPTVVIWTRESLSESDKNALISSTHQINGIGSPKIFEFYNEANVDIPKYGLSIQLDKGLIKMNNPSCWALLAGGDFTKGSLLVTPGMIENVYVSGILDAPPLAESSGSSEETLPSLEEEAPGEDVTPGENITPGEEIIPTDDVTPSDNIILGDDVTPGDDITPTDDVTLSEDVTPSKVVKSSKDASTDKIVSANGSSTSFPDTGDSSSIVIGAIVLAMSICALLIRRKCLNK